MQAFLHPLPHVVPTSFTHSSKHSAIPTISKRLPKKRPSVPHRHAQILATSSRGFGNFLSPASPNSNFRDALPDVETPCPCGSDAPYGRCCRRFHSGQAIPQGAEELLRSRYSAYAYRLPSYIMKTTHSSLSELDRRKWKKEILDFCLEYRFVGGVDVIETQMTGPSSTRILFRANLMERNSYVSFLEMSSFLKERNIWYYKSGKLVDINDEG